MNRFFLSGIEDSINPLVRTIIGDLTYVNLSFLAHVLDNEPAGKVLRNLCKWGDCVSELVITGDAEAYG